MKKQFGKAASTQRQLKTGVPQGGVISPTLFKIFTSDITSAHKQTQRKIYVDRITVTATHINMQTVETHIQLYMYNCQAWTRSNIP